MRDPHRGPIRRHIAQPRHHKGQRLVRRQPQRQPRRPQQLQRRRQHRAVKTDRQRIILALIPRHFGVQPHRKELARRHPQMLRRGNDRCNAAVSSGPNIPRGPGGNARPSDSQVQNLPRDPRRWARPASATQCPSRCLRRGIRRRGMQHIGPIGRVILGPVRDALQPAVPPAHRHLAGTRPAAPAPPYADTDAPRARRSPSPAPARSPPDAPTVFM